MPLISSKTIYPALDPEFASFASRRSVVHSTEGIVACTQPLAAKCGLQTLQKGGNAAVCISSLRRLDCIANSFTGCSRSSRYVPTDLSLKANSNHLLAAGLNITEPCSTGIGGDMFCLFYDAKTKKVAALNGSGRAPGKNTLDTIRNDLGLQDEETGKIPMSSVHAVSVPGAAAGWIDCVERFGSGKLSMEEILAPAIKLGEEGFPVHEIASLSVCLI